MYIWFNIKFYGFQCFIAIIQVSYLKKSQFCNKMFIFFLILTMF
jgi:hypothetical protein